MRKGFTLIELLVVVLIIGILAAIAFPQYERAVLKSKMNSVLPLIRAIKNANEIYFMANGEYTDDLRKLDITIPAGTEESNLAAGLVVYQNGTYIDQYVGNDALNGDWNVFGGIRGIHGEGSCVIRMYYDQALLSPGKIACRGDHPQCASICKSMAF